MKVADYTKEYGKDYGRKYAEIARMDGDKLYNSGQYEDAAGTYSVAILLNPDNPVLYLSRGSVLCNLKRYKEALEDYNKAIDSGTKDLSVVYLNRGHTLYNLQRYEEALEDYNKVIELKPKDSAAFLGKGNVLRHLDDHTGAIESYKACINLAPKDYLGYMNMCISLFSTKQYEEVIKVCNKVIEMKPGYASVYNNRAIAFYLSNHFDKALEDITQAIKINPGSKLSKFYCNRITINKKLNNESEVEKDFSQLIKTSKEIEVCLGDMDKDREKVIKVLVSLHNAESSNYTVLTKIKAVKLILVEMVQLDISHTGGKIQRKEYEESKQKLIEKLINLENPFKADYLQSNTESNEFCIQEEKNIQAQVQAEQGKLDDQMDIIGNQQDMAYSQPG